jgi:hypothetical protein
MENKLNLRLFLGSLALAVVLVVGYELYWRNQGYLPSYDDSSELWSYWRGKVDDLTPEDVVIVGSSRSHFNINIHLFDSLTGHRPVMLSVPGGSPYYTMEDIVKKTEFKGLLIVGVAPGLFYTLGTGGGAMWVKDGMVDYYHKQTLASKFSQAMYEFIDPNLAYLNTDITLKKLLPQLNLPNRDSIYHDVIWPPFVSMDRYRNIRMAPIMETDTAIQNRQTKIWDGGWENSFKDSVDVILNHYASLANEFKKRGGRIAFLQSPVTGKYLEYEPKLFPRETYWDVLLQKAEAPGYIYEDIPEMKTMRPPEWSHLNRKDADQFTKILVSLLKKDGLLN